MDISIKYSPISIEHPSTGEQVDAALIEIDGVADLGGPYEVIAPEGDGIDCWMPSELARHNLTNNRNVIAEIEMATHSAVEGERGEIRLEIETLHG